MALPPSKVLHRFAGLADDPDATDATKPALSWRGRLALMVPTLPIPPRLLPPTDRRLLRVYRLARHSGLFDPQWYVARYPAARAASADPLRHFLERGAARGFLPSPLWRGLDADGCAALAERYGKAGRSLCRYMREQRGPGAEAFLHSARLGRELAPFGPWTARDFARALDRGLATEGRLAIDLLVADHAMGGGANRYRDQRIAEALEIGQTVGLLTYRLSHDQYLLDLCDGDSCVLVTTRRRVELEELLQRVSLGRILLNNLASYPDVLQMIGTLRRIAAAAGAKLDFALHDYFALCPSFNLLDDRQVFCGVPAMERCRACLARVDLPVPVLNAPRDIDAWRATWARLLDHTREIIAFSASSRELLARAYPGVDPQRVTVRPHTVDYLPERTIVLDTDAALHIGVVGEISFAKGAEVVAELLSPAAAPAVAGQAERHRHAGPALRRGHSADRALPRRAICRTSWRSVGSMSAWCRRSGPRPSATSPRS